MRTVLAIALFSTLAQAAMAVDVGSMWDFGKPAESERRFREAMDGASDDDKLVLQTQVARSYGLRKDFARAREVLAQIEPKLRSASPQVQARYFLERGRTYASAAHPADLLTPESLGKARASFLRAYDIAAAAGLDELAIDALHMMPFVDAAPARQLEWDRKAIAYMERSRQPEAKRWEGALRNNLGHALRITGEYDAALEQFRLSRAAYERAGRTRNVRFADWMIARTYREQKRYAEALAIQLRLEREWDAAGEPDPEVFEELEQLYRALGDEASARRYAARRAGL